MCVITTRTIGSSESGISKIKQNFCKKMHAAATADKNYPNHNLSGKYPMKPMLLKRPQIHIILIHST